MAKTKFLDKSLKKSILVASGTFGYGTNLHLIWMFQN